MGVSAADTGGSLTTALTALAVVLNASTHPYFTPITWSSDATKIYGTADVAGCPFVFVGSVSGGTGTLVNGYTVDTANAGPNDWTSTANWSGGAIPVSSDTVIFKDNSTSVRWGFAQSAVTLTELRIEKTYTGQIGLNRVVFATTADGGTTVTTKPEYRATYLAISATDLKIGEHYGPGSPAGSSRIMIDLGTVASTVQIFGTAQTSSEVGRPAIRLLTVCNTTDMYVRSVPGGFGIAVDAPGEVSTVRKLSVSDTSTASRVLTGPAVTMTTYEQNGGTNVLQIVAAGTLTTLTMNGGNLTTEGNWVCTTANAYAGTITANHYRASGNAFTTLNMEGATVDAQDNNFARTWATVNFNKGTLHANGSNLTITTLNDRSGQYTMTVTQ